MQFSHGHEKWEWLLQRVPTAVRSRGRVWRCHHQKHGVGHIVQPPRDAGTSHWDLVEYTSERKVTGGMSDAKFMRPFKIMLFLFSCHPIGHCHQQRRTDLISTAMYRHRTGSIRQVERQQIR